MSLSFKKKDLPKRTKDLSKEHLLEILKKKKECNSIALKIVETLCEQNVNEEWMLANLANINQSHYEDAVTERSILKFCGYPLCSNVLGVVPKQQYRISLANKTVYDITDRKKYCTGDCYKASQFLQSQILTSPLWFRDSETIPVFKIEQKKAKCSKEAPIPIISPEEGTTSERLRNDESALGPENITKHLEKKTELSEISLDKRNENKKTTLDCIEPMLDPVAKVEKALAEWFTVNSFVYLLGEEKLKTEFQGKHKIIRSAMDAESSMSTSSKRFEDISKLYSILNLDGDGSRENSDLKPLPDYSILKAEAGSLNIKVKAFYTGQLEMAAEKLLYEQEDNGLVGELPFVDSQAQVALRRRVLLDRLIKVVPDMCVSLAVGSLIEISVIRCLVQTFSLSANNVTFKPREWFLLAAIIVKMLSLKMDAVARHLASEESKKRVTLLLMSYNVPCDYLDNLMEWLTDTDRLNRYLNS